MTTTTVSPLPTSYRELGRDLTLTQILHLYRDGYLTLEEGQRLVGKYTEEIVPGVVWDKLTSESS